MTPTQYKAKRLALGYNQGELAKLLGLPREAIVRREGGTQRITLESVIAIKAIAGKPAVLTRVNPPAEDEAGSTNR